MTTAFQGATSLLDLPFWQKAALGHSSVELSASISGLQNLQTTRAAQMAMLKSPTPLSHPQNRPNPKRSACWVLVAGCVLGPGGSPKGQSKLCSSHPQRWVSAQQGLQLRGLRAPKGTC